MANITLSKAPQRGLLPKPVYMISRRPGFASSLFAVVFATVSVLWIVYIRYRGWGPAFPLPRTVLVLLAATIPTWAALMLLKQAWPVQRRENGPYKPLPAEEEDLLPTSAKIVAQHNTSRVRRALPFVLLVLGGLIMLATYENHGDIRYRPMVDQAVRQPKVGGYANGDKIFIAALFFNNAAVLPMWTREMMKTIHYLGPSNVFVSIIESNSVDDTPRLLQDFDAQLRELGVERRILVGDKVHQVPPHMEFSGTPRIDYLAKMRNQVLEPLTQATTHYDRLLFSNDVFVSAESVVELLKTNDGNYDQVCSFDFDNFGLYDAWVMRDRLGHFTSAIWPYLTDPVGAAAVSRDLPAPVFSCWNGITVMTAEPFLPIHLRSNTTLSRSVPTTPLPSSHPNFESPRTSPFDTTPYQFRHSQPEECFSSECFLSSYDFRRVYDLQNIFVNPRVIVAYEWRYYVWYKMVLRHWLVRAWIENVEANEPWRAAKMIKARMILGKPKDATRWDGGDCFPWLNDADIRNAPLNATQLSIP